jgi:transposase-like protein
MRASSAVSTRQKWADLVRQHEQSGAAVKIFCRDHGVSEPSFYSWRKRLGATEPVRFALVDAGNSENYGSAPFELILRSGDRLRIGAGVDAATLRAVIGVLRELA